MSYVGWKDAASALRYIDPAQSFGGLARANADEPAITLVRPVPEAGDN